MSKKLEPLRPIDWSDPELLIRGPDGNLYRPLRLARELGKIAADPATKVRNRDVIEGLARQWSAAVKGDPVAQAQIERRVKGCRRERVDRVVLA